MVLYLFHLITLYHFVMSFRFATLWGKLWNQQSVLQARANARLSKLFGPRFWYLGRMSESTMVDPIDLGSPVTFEDFSRHFRSFFLRRVFFRTNLHLFVVYWESTECTAFLRLHFVLMIDPFWPLGSQAPSIPGDGKTRGWRIPPRNSFNGAGSEFHRSACEVSLFTLSLNQHTALNTEMMLNC